MKRKIFLGFVIIITFILSGCFKNENNNEEKAESFATELKEANKKSIDMDINEIIIQDDKNGIAEIIVKIPDYKKLYKTAYVSSDPDKYLLKALKNGEYESVEHLIMADITIEDGEEVIHTEEALKELLEQETMAAINEMMEVE